MWGCQRCPHSQALCFCSSPDVMTCSPLLSANPSVSLGIWWFTHRLLGLSTSQASSHGYELREAHNSSASPVWPMCGPWETHMLVLPEKPWKWGLIASWAIPSISHHSLDSGLAPVNRTLTSQARVRQQSAFLQNYKGYTHILPCIMHTFLPKYFREK